MSHIPIFSYKQYLDDMMRLKDQGHVDVDIQVARPTSAGSRGLARTRDFVKQPVHMMGESQGVAEANNPAQQAAIAINMKKEGKKPKNESEKEMYEAMEIDESKNSPTNPKLWASSLAWAKSRYDVCPSAYCNGAAAKHYKSKGGGWRKTKK